MFSIVMRDISRLSLDSASNKRGRYRKIARGDIDAAQSKNMAAAPIISHAFGLRRANTSLSQQHAIAEACLPLPPPFHAKQNTSHFCKITLDVCSL